MAEKMLDVSTVAARLNVSPSTIRNFLRDPRCLLRGARIGRSIRVHADSIDAFIKQGERDLLEL